MIIAIDGTLASGKGTIARRLSGLFGLPYMDTGQLYRATGVAALRRQIDFDDPVALAFEDECGVFVVHVVLLYPGYSRARAMPCATL